MSAQSAVMDGRIAAEARMTSRVTVRRKTGATTTDADGFEVPAWDVVHTDLPFRSSGSSSSDGGSRGVVIGSIRFEEATGVGHFPADTTDFEDGDLIEVTSGEWVGDVYRVVAAIRYDQKTARRLPIVEAPRPGEWA